MSALTFCTELVEFGSSEESPLQTLNMLWQRCVDERQNARAWDGFLGCAGKTLMAVARRVAMQSGWSASDPIIEDIFQEVCLKVSQISKKMPKTVLQSEGSAQAYLKAIATNAAIDVIRKERARSRGTGVTIPMEGRFSELAGALGCSLLDQHVLMTEIDAALDVSVRDRYVFWLYYKQGLTAQQIAKIPRVDLSAKGVESLLSRMVDCLRKKLGNEGFGKSARAGGC